MKGTLDVLEQMGIEYEFVVASAHRAPDRVRDYAQSARDRGIEVLIAGAGGSAGLPGVLASWTTLPVIGVPMASGPLVGVDAALSTMQMPPGIPVACMAIGGAGATNSAIYAAGILAVSDRKLATKLGRFKKAQARKVAKKDADLQKSLQA